MEINSRPIDANGLFWGKPQEIHLEKRCMGMTEPVVMPYHVPSIIAAPIPDSRGCHHYQYNTIVLMKVQLRPGHLNFTKLGAARA